MPCGPMTKVIVSLGGWTDGRDEKIESLYAGERRRDFFIRDLEVVEQLLFMLS